MPLLSLPNSPDTSSGPWGKLSEHALIMRTQMISSASVIDCREPSPFGELAAGGWVPGAVAVSVRLDDERAEVCGLGVAAAARQG